MNPSNKDQLVCTFQDATEEHADLAIQAALAAKKSWASLSPEARLLKFRDLEFILEKWRSPAMATALVECGYTANEVSASWAEMIDFVRFNSYFYLKLLREQLADGPSETNMLQLRPLKGFTCAVTPFNFPIAIGFNLPLVMALTGNTVVWKPSNDAVLTSYMLMMALDEAGFPPGVINMLTGAGPGFLPKVLTHPELSCLNFTGSLPTAKAFGNYLYSNEYPRANFPRFIAETGGKDFFVADKDICVQEAAQQIVAGAFGRSGQKCSATSLLFVHEDVWSSLKSVLIKATESLCVLDPKERNSDLGPVINERAFDKICGFIDRAQKSSDVELLVGGKADKSKGYYIHPTLYLVSSNQNELLTTEIFGPVVAIKIYKNIDEVFKIMDSHPYRLTGSVMSRNETFLEGIIPELSQYAGNFYVNRRTTGAVVHQQPFGGDGGSGTNNKAGGLWYLLNFVSQGTITRRHARQVIANPFEHALLK